MIQGTGFAHEIVVAVKIKKGLSAYYTITSCYTITHEIVVAVKMKKSCLLTILSKASILSLTR